MLKQSIKLKEPVKATTSWTFRENVRLKVRYFKAKTWELLASRQIDEVYCETLYVNRVPPFQEVEFCSEYIHLFKSFGFEALYDYEWLEKVNAVNSPSLIEPERGWIISPPFHLIRDCLIDSPLIEKPWILNYLFNYWSSANSIEYYPEVISLRDSAECNYWHFFNDLIGGRLRLIEECSLSPEIPIVVSKKLYSQPFFQAVLKKTRLSSRQFILQDKQFIRAGKIFYCQTSRHQKKSINYILNLLNVPKSNPMSDRKVFLTRERRSGRNILNIDTIENLCEDFGFEIIDTAQMPLDEQIQLFSECRYVIGIHGAGLTNIIFRRNAKMSLLEIMPPLCNHPYSNASPPPLHFFFWAHALGFTYDLMLGETDRPGPWTSSFKVDVELFTRKVKRMLAV